MRSLGIDFGDARIGLAMSDSLGIIANGLEVHKVKSLEESADYISSVAKKNNVDVLVIGLPLNMDGSSGPRCERTKEFASLLREKTNLPIEFVDERLTTVESEKVLIEAGKNRDKRKELIDMISATIILQNYLNRF